MIKSTKVRQTYRMKSVDCCVQFGRKWKRQHNLPQLLTWSSQKSKRKQKERNKLLLTSKIVVLRCQMRQRTKQKKNRSIKCHQDYFSRVATFYRARYPSRQAGRQRFPSSRSTPPPPETTLVYFLLFGFLLVIFSVHVVNHHMLCFFLKPLYFS